MGTKATGTIEAKTWDEQAYSEIEGGPKLAASKGVDLYHGDVEGEATYGGITVYDPSGSAVFMSVQRLVGRLGDREGSFVVQIDGTVDATGSTKAKWKVLPGSGTGQLKGLRGKGGFVYGEKENSYTLDYDFA